jgi:teichuronic acid biosynthesis glycosyltransferase TuaC
MRILFVPKDLPTESNPHRGIFILRRIQAVAALGHEVSALVPVPYAPNVTAKWRAYNAVPERRRLEGIPVHTVRVPILPRFIGAEFLPLFLRGALEREMREFKPDIVHASYLIPCGQLVVRQRQVPSIVTTHGFDAYHLPYKRPGLYRASVEAVSKATRVTAVSGYLAQCLQRLAPRKVDVIWNGADERFFYPRDRLASRAQLDLPPDRCIVAYAGNLLRNKGLVELVEAIGRMTAHERPLLVLAGTGELRADLEAAAADLHIDVRFLGGLPHSQIGTLFGAADIVTLPSYYEGLPNVVCEAMLSQRAVVATTAGGIPEIVQNERTGLLVPPRDAQALSAALERCVTDREFRERLAAAAHEFASANLTWTLSAKRYEHLYQETIDDWQHAGKGLAAAGGMARAARFSGTVS